MAFLDDLYRSPQFIDVFDQQPGRPIGQVDREEIRSAGNVGPSVSHRSLPLIRVPHPLGFSRNKFRDQPNLPKRSCRLALSAAKPNIAHFNLARDPCGRGSRWASPGTRSGINPTYKALL
jgi:hypothetical protein